MGICGRESRSKAVPNIRRLTQCHVIVCSRVLGKEGLKIRTPSFLESGTSSLTGKTEGFKGVGKYGVPLECLSLCEGTECEKAQSLT